MRATVFASLILGLISLAGCQSNKIAYQVQTRTTPIPDTNQYLVKIEVFQLSASGGRVVASPSTMVRQNEEAEMRVIMPRGTTFDSKILVDQATSFTSVSLSKKGKVFWSSKQTTAVNSKS